MFTMACKELGEVLIKAHRDRITVRVIYGRRADQLPNREATESRYPGSNGQNTFFMHHKFVVVDNKALVNGSLKLDESGCVQ